jgi:hypothetical protein
MKKLVILTALAAFLCCGARSQPKLSVDTMDIDLGVMYNGATKAGKIKLKNIGNQPLKILRVQPSCGCTTVRQPKKELLPGESDVVEVSFNSTLYRGMVEKYVNVETNDPTSQYTAIKLIAEVKEELAPTASSYSLWLGDIVVGKRAEQAISFKNLTGRTISVNAIVCSSDKMSAVSDKKRVGPADTVKVTISALAEKQGYESGTVTIQTDSRNQPSVDLKVYYIGRKEN